MTDDAPATAPKLDDVWGWRDYPVLLEVCRHLDSRRPGTILMSRQLADATGLTVRQVDQAGEALRRRGLIRIKTGMGEGAYMFLDASAEAYFLTGLHPHGDDLVSRLVDALRQAADQTDDPAEKSKLRALADHALGVGRDVLGGVLVAVATQGIAG